MMTKMVMIMMMLMMMMMMMMTLTTMLAAALWKVHRSFRDYIACLDMLGNALTMMIDVNQVQSILLRCWPMSSAILHPATDISAELSCRFITASHDPLLKQSPRGNRNDKVQHTENQSEEAPPQK